jgi:hypothetical protein
MLTGVQITVLALGNWSKNDVPLPRKMCTSYIPRTYGYITLHGKRGFADVIKGRDTGDYPGLSRQPQGTRWSFHVKDGGGRVRDRDFKMLCCCVGGRVPGPKNAGSLENLGKSRKQVLAQSLQHELSPADALVLTQ